MLTSKSMITSRAQSSSAFGISAIFPHFALPSYLDLSLSSYTRFTDSGNILKCWYCTSCGSRLLHENFKPDGKVGSTVSVKGGCFGEKLGKEEFGLDLASATHIWTTRAVVPIPEGARAFEDDGPERM